MKIVWWIIILKKKKDFECFVFGHSLVDGKLGTLTVCPIHTWISCLYTSLTSFSSQSFFFSTSQFSFLNQITIQTIYIHYLMIRAQVLIQ